jgi:chromosome segregation ATPase
MGSPPTQEDIDAEQNIINQVAENVAKMEAILASMAAGNAAIAADRNECAGIMDDAAAGSSGWFSDYADKTEEMQTTAIALNQTNYDIAAKFVQSDKDMLGILGKIVAQNEVAVNNGADAYNAGVDAMNNQIHDYNAGVEAYNSSMQQLVTQKAQLEEHMAVLEGQRTEIADSNQVQAILERKPEVLFWDI